jgi:hypothetical protein
MTQKEKISNLIEIVELLTKRIKKIELDVLKTNEISKEIDEKILKRVEELEEKTAYI